MQKQRTQNIEMDIRGWEEKDTSLFFRVRAQTEHVARHMLRYILQPLPPSHIQEAGTMHQTPTSKLVSLSEKRKSNAMLSPRLLNPEMYFTDL